MLETRFTRRQAMAAGFAGALAPGGALSSQGFEGRRPLRSRFLCEVVADLEPSQDVGETPGGHRRIAYVKGGTIHGPRVQGTILPGGGDWLIRRTDGTSVLDIRATVRTDNGDLIYMNYRGYARRYLPTAPSDPSTSAIADAAHYFRVAPFFETASTKYTWLNNILAIGVGERTSSGVAYTFHEIL